MAATRTDDRAVVLLGDPTDLTRRGVEMSTGRFESWSRSAWGKQTRRANGLLGQPEMGSLKALVVLENGDLVEVEPCQVRFRDKTSRHQYPNC